MHSTFYTDLAYSADERGQVVAGFCELTPTEGGRLRVAVLLRNPDREDQLGAYTVTTVYRLIPDPPQHPDDGRWIWASRETAHRTLASAQGEFAVMVIRDAT